MKLAALRLLAKALPMKEFTGNSGVYMRRYQLFRDSELDIKVYFHQILRADEDEELHCHPWYWAKVVVLAGGYVEQRFRDGAPAELLECVLVAGGDRRDQRLVGRHRRRISLSVVPLQRRGIAAPGGGIRVVP